MRARSAVAAVAVGAVVVVALQRGVLVLPVLAVTVAAALAGATLVAMERTRERPVLTGGAVLGVVTTLTSMVQLAVAGTPVLSVVYLAGWVVTVLLGASAATAAVWFGGRLAERGAGDPRTLR